MKKARIINIIAILIIVLTCVVMFANTMTKPLSRDENMYCTAAALMSYGLDIYKDFAYPSQLPYHPLICSAFYKILNTTNYLLVARLLSCICQMLIIICIYNIYQQIFQSNKNAATLSAAAAALLYTFNPMVDYAAGYAWNHDLVILCILLSFWLFTSIDFNDPKRYSTIFLIAALLTIATFTRITSALIFLIFFCFIITAPAATFKHRLKTTLPFIISSLLFSAWPLYAIAKAPKAFLLNLITIPTLYGQWLAEKGLMFSKLRLTFFCMTLPGYLIITILAIAALITIIKLRKTLTRSQARNFTLLYSIIAAIILIVYIPPTIWRQYFSLPISFAVVMLAYPLSKLTKNFKIASITLFISAWITLIANPIALQRLIILSDPSLWTPVKVNRIAKKIEQLTPHPQTALTLAPLYAIQGRCLIYPELSTGSITYRIADRLTPDQRKTTRTAGPSQMKLLTRLAPPNAAILNVEPLPGLEQTLSPYIPENFKTLVFEDNGPVVHYKP